MSVSVKMIKESVPCEQLRQEYSYYLDEVAKSRQLIEMVHDDDYDDYKVEKYSNSSSSGSQSSLGSGHNQPGVALEAPAIVRFRSRRTISIGTVESPTVGNETEDMNIDDQAAINEQLEIRERQDSIARNIDSRYKINKLLLEFYALFCHLNLFATMTSDQARPKIELRLFGSSKIKFYNYKSNDRRIWSESIYSFLWPKIVLLAYILSTCHVLCNLYCQYGYDYYLFRLKRVRWLNQTQPSEILAKLELEQEDYLLANLDREHKRLARIGAPHMHLSFASQCNYLLAVILPLCTYLAPAFYYRYWSPFNFYFIRNFLKYSDEHRRNRKFVKLQVVSFIKSSSNHVRALEEFSFRSIGKRLTTEKQQASRQSPVRIATSAASTMKDKTSGERPGQASGANASDRMAGMASRSHRQLIEMFESNHLRPMNQSLKWIERQSTWYAALCLLCGSFALFIFSSFALVLIGKRDTNKQLTWQDIAILIEVIFLTAISPVTTVFYGTLLIFTCLDLSFLARKLRKLMSHVIDLNTIRFYKNLHLKIRHDNIRQTRRMSLISLRECPATNKQQDTVRQLQDRVLYKLIDTHAQLIKFDSSYEAKMNNDLLLALMQYRIFVSQLKIHTKATNYIAGSAALIMFIFPILYRLHLPYIDKTDTSLNFLVVYLCYIIVVPVNMSLLPTCYLHKRCLEVYSQLNSLLAHATDVISHPEGRDIYDGHILSMLRKEMMYPDRIAAKFALKCAGISFTYSSLVRFQFYFGFIILSIFSEWRNSNQEISGTIFSDPFGLF